MQVFGSYKIVKQLGEGAMGSVLLVESPDRHAYALKLLHAELERREDFVERFLRELRIALSMKHAHIVEAFHGGQAPGGGLYMLTEFCPGGGLDHWLEQRGKLDLADALPWLAAVVEALEYAFLVQQVVHRDIKPGNLLLDGRQCIKLGDLGLAKHTGADATDLTTHGSIVGALLYMSPEQASAATDLDIRTDLYSLGATFYQLFSGHPPFTGKAPIQVIMAIRNQQPVPLSTLRPDLPAPLVALITALLEKDRDDRPQSAQQVLEALAEVSRVAGRPMDSGRPPGPLLPAPDPFG